ncbi:MAG TPA: hypothetical protein VM914_04880 [Pyrinomonadaceae bacterium]|jgi:hypothetical protein|nr:hypothetical protein [Pyrinomonadaceae bacterium]
MIITEDEKARIRAEEEFRAELKREFAEKQKPNRLWTFVNSTFGLWLLGSVTLTGITFLYQSHESSYKTAAERAEVRRKVRQELATRFNVAEYYLIFYESERPATLEQINFVLRAANGEDSVSFVEFRGVSANTLFAQLIQVDESGAGARLSEQDKGLLPARENWTYLEPKLRVFAGQSQSGARFTTSDLRVRLGQIVEKLRL